MRSRKFIRLAAWVFAPTLLAAVPAFAATGVLTVGSGCTFSNIQSAVDAASGNNNIIHVRAGSYAPFKATGKVLYIGGGYPDCNDDSLPSPGQTSTVDGTNSGHIGIEVQSGNTNETILNLHDLVITRNGNTTTDGGGIRFRGHGELDLTNVVITDNIASNGAGIDIDPDNRNGTAPDGATIVSLLGATSISGNRTAGDGGGVRLRGSTRLLVLPDPAGKALISANIAGGNGGGLMIDGDSASAIIGVNDLPDAFNVVSGNNAFNGGGMTIAGGGQVRLFTTRLVNLVGIGHNTATNAGGAIYLKDDNSRICGGGYDFNFNGAPNGAVIYADDNSMGATFDRTDHTCGGDPGVPLNEVNPIIASTIHNNSGLGDLITIRGSAPGNVGPTFRAQDVEFRFNNNAGRMLYLSSTSTVGTNNLINCLIADNRLGDEITQTENGAGVTIDSCTIVNNQLDATNVFVQTGVGARFKIRNSILWQPGLTSLIVTHGTTQALDVIASETPSLTTGTFDHVVQVDDPHFVDLARHDYHLTADSAAVDFTANNALGLVVDLDGLSRGVDLRHTNSVFDIGAFELQRLPNGPTFCTEGQGDYIFCSTFDAPTQHSN